ncbi:MAG: hypothetical protein DCC71_21075 [Proteobacteria bacterium]|nr:MAG: hypothetical protein DCC71_21075 [Pseudomonadota bacterium]
MLVETRHAERGARPAARRHAVPGDHDALARDAPDLGEHAAAPATPACPPPPPASCGPSLLDFDAGALAGLGEEMRWLAALARDGKLVQGRFVARRRRAG